MAEQKFYATGRRKTSVARVWMKPGTGEITINKRTMDEYFGRPTSKMVVRQPLELTDNIGKFDIDVNVCGGGPSGQAGELYCFYYLRTKYPPRCQEQVQRGVQRLHPCVIFCL